MTTFNTLWAQHLKTKGLAGTVQDNQAYKEYYRTKGMARFNWEGIIKENKHINQYYTRITFDDGSTLLVSSNRNKVNLNSVRYYPSSNSLCFAERKLFGISSKMPWEA